MIPFIAKELKKLKDYETLKQNEIEAWLFRALGAKMNKACYATAEDYFQALEKREKTKSLLQRAKTALILSGAEVSYDSEHSQDEHTKVKLIDEIEELIRELK